MPIRDKLPQIPNDPEIRIGDTGEAVKEIQKFLQKLSYVKKAQDFLKDFNRGYSLLDQRHLGNFERDTRLMFSTWQKQNKEAIKKAGNLSEEQFNQQLGVFTYASNSVMFGGRKVVAKPIKAEPVKKKEEIASPIPEPSIPENNSATHFVKTKNPKHRLALRKSPAWVKVSKDASKDNDKKGKLVMMMPQNTLLKVIEPFLGFKCRWHRVEVVDANPIFDDVKKLQDVQFLYCYAEFVQPLSRTPQLLPVYCEECTSRPPINGQRATPFPDWRGLTECEPFYDEETCSYYITITTNYTSTNNDLVIQQKQEAIVDGVELLLEFYNKQRDIDTIINLLSAFEFANVPDGGVFLDERPGSRLKILVRIPAKYLDAIPENTDYLQDIPTSDGVLPFGWKTAHFRYTDLVDNIETVVKRFEEYDEEVKDWKGDFSLDLKIEASRLKSFIPQFNNFLINNKIPLSEARNLTFEFGFSGECFDLIYVLRNVENESIPLRIGFECFRQSEPIVFETTMGYIFYIEEMAKDIKISKKPWLAFLLEYTCPLPSVQASKTKPKKTLPRKKVSKKIKTTKTAREKEIEDLTIQNPQYRKEVFDIRKAATDFIGDPIFDCDNLQNILGRITSVDEIYEEILHKTDVASVAKFVAYCIATKLGLPDLNKIVVNLILKALKYDDMLYLLAQGAEERVREIQEELQRRIAQAQALIDDVRSWDETVAKEILLELLRQRIPIDEIIEMINRFDPELIEQYFQNLKQALIQEIQNLRNRIPTIIIPDRFPIEDIMSQIGALIEEAVRAAINKALLSAIRQVFDSLCSFCANDTNPTSPSEEVYGEENINDIINVDNHPDIIRDLNQNDVGLLRDFFDDISSILLPSEICSLLDGTPSLELLNVIKLFTKEKYPSLLRIFNIPSKTREFFLNLGQFIDPEICRNISERVEKPSESLCFDETDEFRRSLLDSRMSAEQIDKQLSLIKDRDINRIENLLDIANEDILSGEFDFDKQCFAAKFRQPSVDYLSDQVIKSMFDGLDSLFNNDIMNYKQSLVASSITDISALKNAELLEKSQAGSEDFKKATNQLNKKFNSREYKEVKNIENRQIAENNPTKEEWEKVQNFYKKVYGNEKLKHVAEPVKSSLENESNFINLQLAPVYDMNSQFYNASGNKKADIKPIRLYCTETEDVKFEEKKEYTVTDFRDATEDGLWDPPVDIGPNTILQFRLPRYVSEKEKQTKERYECIINDKRLNVLFNIRSSIDLSPDIKNHIKNIKLSSKESLYQSVFADILKRKLTNGLMQESAEKVKDINSDFHKIFSKKSYHETILFVMKQVAKEIADSPFFLRENMDRVEFIPNEQTGLCEQVYKAGLLDIQSIKDLIEQGSSDCANTGIDNSGVRSIIEMIIKLFVVDFMLRGIFVFSEFKVEDAMRDGVVLQFLKEKIKKELESQGGEFYKFLLEKIKENYNSDEEKTVDPASEGNLENQTVEDKTGLLDPEYQSGESMLKYIIERNVLSVSKQTEELLGTKVSNIDRKLLFEWLPTTIKSISSAKQNRTNFYHDFLKKNPGGGFYIEEYLRKCKTGEVVGTDELFSVATEFLANEDKEFSYGVRLMYLPPTQNLVFSDLQYKGGNIFELEKAYQYTHQINTNPIPIVVIEDEDVRTNKLGLPAQVQLLNKLKMNIAETPEYQLMFGFSVSLKRILSLLTIYNMMIVPAVSPGMYTAFDTSKEYLKSLLRVLSSEENWWNDEDPSIEGRGGNVGLLREDMSNISTGGLPNLAGLAAMTVPLILKGLAETMDPSYQLIRGLDIRPTPEAISKVLPVNIFGPIPFGIGWGPPISPMGIAALAAGLLPGERKKEELGERERKLQDEDNQEVCQEKQSFVDEEENKTIPENTAGLKVEFKEVQILKKDKK